MQEILQLPDGTNIYTTDGRLHREDGPAIEFSNGTSYYFIDGVLHRDNGPAISCADPAGCYWFKHGVAITPTIKNWSNSTSSPSSPAS